MRTILLTCAILIATCAGSYGLADNRPNLLIILADDLGYADTGFTGSTEIHTPQLDTLASNGVIFANGYVTHPYCGPSRAGLVTGRYQARFGVEVNFTNSHFDRHSGLPVKEKTFADRLKKTGYRTGIIGKWHLGASYPFHPNNRGFDYFYGFLSGGHTYFPENVTTIHPLTLPNGKPHYSANEGGYWPLMRNDKAGDFNEYLTTALSRDAARFVSQGEEPFCLYLAYNAPHTPLEAPKDVIEKYSHIDDPKRRTYAAMIDVMDQGIGMVIDALEESGKLNNTLIFFLSDNGGVMPKPGREGEDFADNSPYRGGKGSLLEGGINVPFIAHWPDGFAGGTTFEHPVSALDIAATFVALGGGDVSAPPMDGVNLITYINNEKTAPPHEAIYFRLYEGLLWAIRTPDLKLVVVPPFMQRQKGQPELYDLSSDPYEEHNLISSRPDLRAKLARAWNRWNKSNSPNLFIEGEYQAYRLKMYDDLRAELDAKAKQYKPKIVE